MTARTRVADEITAALNRVRNERQERLDAAQSALESAEKAISHAEAERDRLLAVIADITADIAEIGSRTELMERQSVERI